MSNKIGVSLRIDVTKIEKAKLYKGAKGTYLDCTVFIEPGQADQYGNNGMITQSLSKEEREAGQKGAILGNCKVFWGGGEQQQQQPQQTQQQQGWGQVPADTDDIPW